MEFPASSNRLVTPDGATSRPDGTPLLSLEGITRRFGSVVALDNASFSVRPGTVHALLGENGAGKTTLIRIAFGLLSPDAGVIRVRGVPQIISSPSKAYALGLGMVHQHFTLVPAMTVAENVALGGSGRFDPAAADERVHDVAARAGLSIHARARVSTLSVGAQQRCEIVKALARDVEVLILDEPTAVLAPSEAAELLQWMRQFADSGRAVVLITHKLREALSVADDVTVLRRGQTVLVSAVTDTSQDALREAMVGEAIGDVERMERAGTQGERIQPDGAARGVVVLSADGVTYSDSRGARRVRDASLEVRAGEIVGIAAVEGGGQHEFLRLLAGRLKPQRGRITTPASLGFVPEDRHRDALMLDAPLDENIALRGAGVRRGLMPWAAIRESARALLANHDIRASGPRATARTLSGGNQQKLVLARELSDSPDALVVENPSRGLDFQATAAVHRALRQARDAGAAVLMYSSDMDEVLLLADRVYAMFDGQVAEVRREREAIGRAMLGDI